MGLECFGSRSTRIVRIAFDFVAQLGIAVVFVFHGPFIDNFKAFKDQLRVIDIDFVRMLADDTAKTTSGDDFKVNTGFFAEGVNSLFKTA